jgi:hypothetical protein
VAKARAVQPPSSYPDRDVGVFLLPDHELFGEHPAFCGLDRVESQLVGRVRRPEAESKKSPLGRSSLQGVLTGREIRDHAGARPSSRVIPTWPFALQPLDATLWKGQQTAVAKRGANNDDCQSPGRGAPVVRPDLGELIALYYRLVPVEELSTAEPAELAAAVRSHLELAQ